MLGVVGRGVDGRRKLVDIGVVSSLCILRSAQVLSRATSQMMRNTPGMLRIAAIVNVGTCLIWFLASSYGSPVTGADLAGQLVLQLLLAGLVGSLGLIPIALTQNAVMDRLSVPPAPDTP
jgi:hypothetical protein